MERHILVVEDDDTAREALAELLRDEGYDVATAAGGRRALAMIADDVPDLVISEVRMPQGDGFELLRGLRAGPRTARIPVLLVSACADADRRATGLGLELGACDFVTKPIDLGDLLARVHGLLAAGR